VEKFTEVLGSNPMKILTGGGIFFFIKLKYPDRQPIKKSKASTN
jgi:hypothetical protein